MTPLQQPDLFATLVVGTAKSPGTVTLAGHDRNFEWDVQGADGETGASSTLTGEPVRTFQVTFYLATPEDQIAWPAFQRVLESTVVGPEPKALPVYHPDLAANRISEACVQTIGGFARDERGGVTALVKFIEHRPPKPKPTKPATGGGGAGGGAGASKESDSAADEDYDPNAARKRELEALLEEAAEA